MYAIQFSLADLKKELAGRWAAETLAAATALLRKTIQLTRDVTVDLSPAALSDPDLGVALQWVDGVDGTKARLARETRCQVV